MKPGPGQVTPPGAQAEIKQQGGGVADDLSKPRHVVALGPHPQHQVARGALQKAGQFLRLMGQAGVHGDDIVIAGGQAILHAIFQGLGDMGVFGVID